jgi:nucleotide-binding universal stress UspA family protein
MSFAGLALNLQVKSVLLATDLSPASLNPLHHALAIARHYGAKLYVVHVVSPVPYLMAGPEALQLGCDSASQDLQQLQRGLLQNGSLNGLDHEFVIRRGVIGDELQEVITEAQIDLAVVGTHGRRGLERLILGSVAEEIFRDAECPVLTVGPHSYREGRVEFTGETRRYLFATDFGQASLNALPHAVSLARKFSAKLILAHVISTGPTPQIDGWYSASEAMSTRDNARMACVRQLDQLVPPDERTQIEIEFVVQFGIPSEKIMQTALHRGVDLIILGLRGSTLASAMSHMPWATAYEIVCGAGCPVLTVRR